MNLVAIIDTHYKLLSKRISKELRNNDDLKKIERKISRRIAALPQFAETVNSPLRVMKIESEKKPKHNTKD